MSMWLADPGWSRQDLLLLVFAAEFLHKPAVERLPGVQLIAAAVAISQRKSVDPHQVQAILTIFLIQS